MKQKRAVLKQKPLVRDFGKDLYNTLLFLLTLIGVLWLLQ
jgi:hypothetical protein